MENKTGLTRRSFLNVAALGTLGIASGTALAACSSQSTAESTSGSDASTETSRTWKDMPDPIADADIAETHETDVVVLGAGQAGSSAARAAAESGANVIVIESQAGDAYTVNGSEIGTINSQHAIRRGVPEYDPQDFVRECLLRSLNRSDARIMKQFAENSGRHLDWFVDPLGEEWWNEVHTFMNPAPTYWTGTCNGMRNFIGTSSFFGGEGYTLTEATLVQHKLAQDAGAQFFYGTTAVQPVMDGDACTGLMVQAEDGSYLKIEAKKGVLLCGGGFSANEEMVRDLLPEYVAFNGDTPPVGFGRDGSGIRIGVWAGGHVEEDPRAGIYSNQSGYAGSFGATAFLRLNDKGERYSNEGMYGAWGEGACSLRQDSTFVCCVFDSNWREELEHQPPEHFMVDVSDTALLTSLEEAMAAIPKGPEGGDSAVSPTPVPFPVAYHYWCADTIEELAQYMGFAGDEAKAFVDSVNRYNEMCNKGIDEDFGKDPVILCPVVKAPFYGYKEEKNNGNLVVTLSGLRINHNQQVVDDDYHPIPGLFACGNNSGSRFAVQYMTPIPGFSVGLAQTMGQILGEYVAAL